MVRGRRRALLVSLVALVVVAGAAVAIAVATKGPPPLTPSQRAAIAARAAAQRLLREESTDVAGATRLVGVKLPTKPGEAAPDPPARLFPRALGSHLVIGYVPYWLLGALGPTDYADASVLAYSSLCIGATGAISEAGTDCSNGASDLDGGAFATFVDDAHTAGDRVLVSVSAFDDAEISKFLTDPVASATRLATGVAPIVAADHLDGVNIDVEGTNPANAGRFVTFVRALASALRASDPTGEIVLDTYAGSAGGQANFFEPGALASLVDQVFVEGYQMDNPDQSSANAPLASPSLGYSDVQSLIQYEKVVPADKLVLGVAFYGLDFETAGPRAGSPAAGAPQTATYAAIATSAHRASWDPASKTPYASFKEKGVWHQLWYDDPVSIALKVALASELHTAGVGAWAFGMEGNANAMLQALTGGSPVRKLGVA